MNPHLDVTPEEYQRLVREGWDEATFQSEVIALARRHGWRVASFRAARVMRHGVWKYETPVGGDGKGWPDMHLTRPGRRTLYVEAKSATGKLSPEQIIWRDWLLACGEDWRLWRPAMWTEIEEVLRG